MPETGDEASESIARFARQSTGRKLATQAG
jgi:hypothetical protein